MPALGVVGAAGLRTAANHPQAVVRVGVQVVVAVLQPNATLGAVAVRLSCKYRFL